MVVTLFYYWDVHGTFSEGREWLARALEQGARTLWGIGSPERGLPDA